MQYNETVSRCGRTKLLINPLQGMKEPQRLECAQMWVNDQQIGLLRRILLRAGTVTVGYAPHVSLDQLVDVFGVEITIAKVRVYV